MWYLKFFQLIGFVFIFLFNSCGQRDLSQNTMESASEYELALWTQNDEAELKRQPNIWDITNRHNSFSTFSLLMEVAGLEETLQADQQITVLAPTEEAFRKLGDGSLVELLKEDNRVILEELLLSHIIPEVYHSVDLNHGETRATLSGRRLTIKREENIKLGNATITTSDIAASNGVVHVVDQVILAD